MIVADWLMSTIESTGYLGLALLMFAENVFPPIPSEAIMPLAGFLVAQGKLSYVGVVLAGMTGSVLGALPLYGLGHWLGGERLERLAARHGHWLTVSPQEIRKARAWFERRGALAVLICRLVPVVRSLISIPAGIARMPLPRFLLYTAIGTCAWSALLAAAGFYLQERFSVVGHYLDPVSKAVAVFIALSYAFRVIRQDRRGGR